MILLFTDYGLGPYQGQLRAALLHRFPGACAIDLCADVPACNVRAAAYLLSAWARGYRRNTVFLCVVDPNVGGGLDRPVIVQADGCWFVGPDNGLFDILVQHRRNYRCWEIVWRPPRLSPTFHGRDLYAPVAADIERIGHPPEGVLDYRLRSSLRLPNDLSEVIYLDRFGNAVTGIRASTLDPHCALLANGRKIERVVTFSDVPAGTPLWYENSSGLAEIAVNRGSAAALLNLHVGSAFHVLPPLAP